MRFILPAITLFAASGISNGHPIETSLRKPDEVHQQRESILISSSASDLLRKRQAKASKSPKKTKKTKAPVEVQQSPFDIAYPTTCGNLKNAYASADCNEADDEPLKTAVLKTKCHCALVLLLQSAS